MPRFSLLLALIVAWAAAPSADAAQSLLESELSALHLEALEAAQAGDPDAALERLGWMLDVVEAEPEALRSTRAVEAVSGVADLADRLPAAGTALRAFEWLCRALPTTPVGAIDLPRARFGRASALMGVGRLEEARDQLTEVVADFERAGQSGRARQARENLAIVFKELGRLEDALALQLEVLDTTPASDVDALAVLHLQLGSTLHELRRHREAEVELRRSLEISDENDAEHWAALRNLAAVLVQRGAYELARPLAERALEALTENRGERHPLTLDARISLAGVLRETGDLEGARDLLERTLRDRRRELPDDHLVVARERENLAVLLGEMGDFEASRTAHERALEAFAKHHGDDHLDVVMACLNLSNTLQELNDLEGAAKLQRAVVAAREKTLPADHSELLFARLHLGRTLRRLGEHEESRTLLRAVRATWEEQLGADHPWTARAQKDLAWTLRLTGDFEEARAHAEDALRHLRAVLPPDNYEIVEATEQLAWTLVAVEDEEALAALVPDYADALVARLNAALTRSPHEARKQADWDLGRQSTLIYLSDRFPGRFDDDVFRVLELHRQVTSAPLEHGEEVDELREQALLLRGAINDLIASGDFDRDRLADLVVERDAVERAIRRQASASVVAVNATALGGALPERAVAVGFRRYTKAEVDVFARGQRSEREHLLAHVVSADGSLVRLDLGPMADLDALVERWRAHHKKPLPRGAFGVALDEIAEDPGVPLRERLLDPILGVVDDEVDTLFVCLDDALHLVPLDALPNGEEPIGARLRLRFRVSFASMIEPRPALASEPALLALGGPSYNTRPDAEETDEATEAISADGTRGAALSSSPIGLDFPPLRQTRFEVENLAELFEEVFASDATLHTKADATKRALQAAAPGTRFLHLATHGYFAPETLPSTADIDETRLGLEVVRGLAPMSLCGLALAGANLGRDALGRVPGILTAEELAGMDLSACELAVLSACETNVGIVRAGQGVRSLQAALHAAGARASITSLWRVDDEWTRVLMEDFYTRLWVRGQDKAEALWDAKTALVARGAEPQHWAAWVLVE